VASVVRVTAREGDLLLEPTEEDEQLEAPSV
jgi:hypothetical protein